MIFKAITPTASDYTDVLNRVEKSSLLQSYAYAYAIRKTQNLEARPFIIEKEGKPIGFFQTHEAKTIFGLLRVVTLDRGPIWFKGFGTTSDIKDFCAALNVYAPKKMGHTRRFMPEIENKAKLHSIIQQAGWHKREVKSYKTIWLDLSQNIEEIRMKFDKKWRNSLNKAEKQDFIVKTDHNVNAFVQGYIKDRMAKKYAGPGVRFLTHLMSAASTTGDLIIINAVAKDDVIASICLIKHGNSATYQAGWTTTVGRALNAHHLLLYKGMNILQKNAIIWLDLGGINEESATGVTQFKRQLNGQGIELIGQFG